MPGKYRSLVVGMVLIAVCGIAPVALAGTLSCTVGTSCPSGTVVLRMAGTSNAHAELASQANYSQLVCCSGVAGLGTSCSGTYDTIAKLSDVTNAHVEQKTQMNYANNACLSVSSGTVSVGYQATNCAGYDTTIASMSAVTTNAHIGDAAAYTNKICATASSSGNATPSVDSVITTTTSGGSDQGSFNLTDGSTTNLYIRGTATDADGCSQIDAKTQWAVTAYKSDVAGGTSCSADNNNCYQLDTNTVAFTLSNCSGGADTTIDYEAVIPIQYYADATDAGSPGASTNWTNFVKVTDDATATANSSDAFEMNSLLALDVGASVNYGTLTLGVDSPQQTLAFTNTGNRNIDATQSASGDISCTRGTIPTSNIHLSFTNGFTYGVGDQALSNTDTNVNLALVARTSEVFAAIKDTYLKLRVPNSGIEGSCSNTIYYIAVLD